MSANDAKEVGFATVEGGEIDQDTYHVGLNVPAGRRAFIVYRELSLTENSYSVDLIRAANGFTGGTEGYQSNLREGGIESVQSRVYGGVTPDGAVTILSQDFVEAGSSPGSAVPPGFKLPYEYLRSYISSPIIRITRFSGGTPYRLSLRAVIYEEEA